MKKIVALIAASVLVLSFASTAMATKPNPDHKATICHRTASDSNPYVFIEVDVASLPAHLNNLPGHPAKKWKSDGVFRGVAHVKGDLKKDYLATDEADCKDFPQTPPPSEEPSITPPPSEEPSITPPPSEEPSITPPPSEETTVPPTDTELASSTSTGSGLPLILMGLTGLMGASLLLARRASKR